jgi:tetratricopeptide (TPR) repeat protein
MPICIFFEKRTAFFGTAVTSIIIVTSCSRHAPHPPAVETSVSTSNTGALANLGNSPDACELAVAPHAGNGRIDREIARQQANVRGEKNTLQSLERLGWLYVAKARESFDLGFYKLAEQCALCLEYRKPHSAEALLLRGHVLQNLHRFKEAETIARDLVAQRGLPFDYGLLGDALMEQGRLEDAAAAYQKMVDEKPDLEAYARIAHLRWLKGDLAGATAVMQLAVTAASPASPEAAAWVNTRLAMLQFQKGNFEAARQTCGTALEYQREYPPALLLKGRLLLAAGRTTEAIEALQRAAQLNPLPDYQWVLSEALHAAKRQDEAAAVERTLLQQGASADPRTFALYLASRGESTGTAVELARSELQTRGDTFTHDALAWSLAADGQIESARTEMHRALAQGTKDARLFLHAGIIAAKAGDKKEAQRWLTKDAPMLCQLLPSEQEQWRNATTLVGDAGFESVSVPTKTCSIFSPEN